MHPEKNNLKKYLGKKIVFALSLRANLDKFGNSINHETDTVSYHSPVSQNHCET